MDLRTTPRGVLVLRTENARRMMRRFSRWDSGTLASMEREESDQLPEEGPAEQVPDDAGDDSRSDAEDTPGVPGEEDRATGHEDD